MTQPLSGIKVIDLTNLLPGPLATLMLSEAGAEVIKIERPGGDDLRYYPPEWQGTGAPFGLLNAGKKSLTLDLKSEAGAEQLRALLQDADILVEQFRPGVMAKLGFGFEAMQQSHPRLIYCSITGYGQSGPRAQEAGHDLNYIGNTGLLGLAPGPADRPVVPPALIADIGGGAFPAVINILLALRHREVTGRGCHLDIAMTDAMFTFAWHALAETLAIGKVPGSGRGDLAGGLPRYRLYPAKDGIAIACAALEDHFWQRFTALLGLDTNATAEAVAKVIATRNAAEWEPVFAKADCCVTVLRSLGDALRDPHFKGRGLFERRVRGVDGGSMMALPLPIAPEFRDAPTREKPIPPLV
jgi:crotonobetainyl-CoA:carnitine CoA-transferase CaiB-like acyl-CoA transferase